MPGAFRISLALVLTLSSLSWASQIVSVGVASVRGQVLTSRQVQMNHLLELSLNEGAATKDLKILPLDSKGFAQAVQNLTQQTVVALEAQSYNLATVTPEEFKRAERQAMKILRSSPVWQQLEPTSGETEALLRQKLQAKKFMKLRAQSSVLPVSDADAEKYFNENRLKFGNLPFANFKENIKSFLSRQQVERRMKDWYDLLMSKYLVKNLIAEM